MITYKYSYTNYKDWLAGFARAMGASPRNEHHFVIPAACGQGHIWQFSLPNGLDMVICDFKLSENLVLHRTASPSRYYTLRFDEVLVSEELEVRIHTDSVKEKGHLRSAVTLTCDMFDLEVLLSKGSSVRSIALLFPETWLARYFDFKEPESVLKQYLAMKTASLNFEPIDTNYRQLMNEIFSFSPEHPLWLAKLENRTMLLAERFFTRLFDKLAGNKNLKPGVSPLDVQLLMEVESALLKSIDSAPPTIPELSRMASMSPSKLKKQFKTVYGLPVYKYYQKHRMHEARKLLMSGKYSVKEVGLRLGYSNLSHFALAFKKEFSVLPSEVLLLN